MVEYLGRQLGIGDVSLVKAYTEREKTPLEHSWGPPAQQDIARSGDTEGFAFRDFPAGAPQLRSFPEAHAWSRLERPSELAR